MGQYYIAANIDKEECASSYDFDNGAKLMEHSWRGNNYVGFVEMLLMPGNSWHKNKIVWAGDYMDDCLFIEPSEINPDQFCDTNLYECACLYYTSIFSEEKIKPAILIALSQLTTGEDFLIDFSLSGQKDIFGQSFCDICRSVFDEFTFLVNHTTKEYVNKSKCINIEGWVVHPLPLLTASGNGRGGGDYRDSDDMMVGAWAGHNISVEKEKPEGYKETYVSFTRD